MSIRPPKKPGGEEAYDINTATAMTCVTASTSENSSQTITDMLDKEKVPNIVRMEKEDNHPMTFEKMAENTIGRLYHEILFMTGKKIRDRGDLLMLDAYMRLRSITKTNQNYVCRKKNIVKPAMKLKVPSSSTMDEDEPRASTTSGPKEFKFLVDTNQSKPP